MSKKIVLDELVLLDLLCPDGNWFKFPHHFLYVLNHAEAVFMSFMINELSMKLDKMKDRIDEGRTLTDKDKKWANWIHCRAKRTTRKTHLSLWNQGKILRKLKDLGYVRVKIKGPPTKRYVKIDLQKLYASITEKMLEEGMVSVTDNK